MRAGEGFYGRSGRRFFLLLLSSLIAASCRSSSPPLIDGGLPDTLLDRTRAELAPAERGTDSSQCPLVSVSEPNVVATDRGWLRGKPAEGTTAFLGIPYAEPPVGTRRFAPPAPKTCWSGIRDATAYGNRCPQRTVLSAFDGNEDCLFLNVWTPALPSEKSTPLPVLLFIHGGANIMGASNEGAASLLGSKLGSGLFGNLYDGATMAAKRKVVVVSVNYRLGALGFLAHPELSKQSPTKTSGNYALLDLIAALQWTKKNIGAFGGDPGKVMIFGESAGALNTCLLLVSPLAKGLFHAALMESGGCQAPSLATREAAGQKVATALGCAGKPDVVACLRAVPASNLVESLTSQINFFDLDVNDILRTWDLPYGAAVDGVVLPDSPMKLLRDGKHNQVPFVIGTNAHEGELFIPPVINTCVDFTLDVNKRFGPLASQVLALYPCSSYTFARWAEVDVVTDAVFLCPARRIARAMATTQSQPVFRYHYRHIYKAGVLAVLRAFHAAELPFVFQTFGAMAYLPTSAELSLSDAIQGYWSRFGSKGDPSGDTATPTWPPYVPATDSNLLVLDEKISTDAGLKAKQCDFWDGLSE